ncbi:hypothetical protein F5Y16DRAFT_423115 [Xylariaceae sp. FL0255]|nr:hypothetical protein F5Y16DRAFT_423115 [Xylariaceae sp. FL0255]
MTSVKMFSAELDSNHVKFLVNTIIPTDLGEGFLDGVISGVHRVRPSSIKRDASSSSIGIFNRLPIELFWDILGHLDFRSLSRFSQVSLAAHKAIVALPQFHEMMTHAPDVLTALSKTYLITCHSSSLIRKVLYSQTCVSCLCTFGGFLFLPTCERVCFECLRANPMLQVSVPGPIKDAFGIDINEMCSNVRGMTAIPGLYFVEDGPVREASGPLALYSIRHVKEAIKKGRISPISPPNHYNLMYEAFHNAPFEPPGRDLSRDPKPPPLPPLTVHVRWPPCLLNEYAGMGSIRFPSLTSTDVVERGQLCVGCWLTYYSHNKDALPPDVEASLVPVGADVSRVMFADAARLRTASEQREHAKTCYGIGLIERYKHSW